MSTGKKIALTLFAIAVVAALFAIPVRLDNPVVLKDQCAGNLRDIQFAKEMWMKDNHKTPDDAPTWTDLVAYLGGNKPVCPDGGTYTIGRVRDPAVCSLNRKGHQLPAGTQESIRQVVEGGDQPPASPVTPATVQPPAPSTTPASGDSPAQQPATPAPDQPQVKPVAPRTGTVDER